LARHVENLPKTVVGTNLLNPFPFKCFAVSFIEFEVVLGIEWALATLLLRKNGTFDLYAR
jgi:hypothetical protein